MENVNIMDKTRGRRYYLNKIKAMRIDEKPEKNTVNISQDTEYEIIENNEKKLVIELKTKTFIEPEALFCIEMEYVIEYMLKDLIGDKEIKDNINTLLSPLGNEISFLISILTNEMINSRVILPPAIALNEEKKDK
ncbi:MAG: hypothetical protein PHT02_01945 [Tissierellia bacterium]|nr:hypothetical protein [Tissierellia bacterium]